MSELVRPLRNSEFSVFRRCHLKWYFTFKLGFLSSKINRHFWLGGLVHFALSEFSLGKTNDAAHLFYEIGAYLIDQERQTSITVGGVEMDYDNAAELEDYLHMGVAMLEGYQEWKSNPDYTVIDSELSYYVQLEDFRKRPFTMVARLDRLDENSEGIRVTDFKTCADFRDQKWIDQDQQFRRYPWMVRRTHKDWAKEIVGSRWTALRKIKPSSRTLPPYYMEKLIDLGPEDYREIERELRAEATDLFNLEEKLAKTKNVREVIYPNPMERCTWDCDYSGNGLCAAWRRGLDVTTFGEHFGTWGVDPYMEYKEDWSTAVPVVIGRREEGGH